MNWEVRWDIVNGYSWRCPVATCGKSIGIRDGTFVQNTRITLQKCLILIDWWVREYCMEEADVSKHIAVDVYQWLREVWSTKLMSQHIELGRPSHIVQTDESFLTLAKGMIRSHTISCISL